MLYRVNYPEQSYALFKTVSPKYLSAKQILGYDLSYRKLKDFEINLENNSFI